MIHIVVQIEPKPEKVEAFLELALFDAQNSRKESGCLRFDVLKALDNPPRFSFYEVYKDEAAVQAHRQTPHYARWIQEIDALQAKPRTAVKYSTVDPLPYA
ncbi:MAG TPA: putative quinol monooxygenase [Planctomycetota bacterium]|nr:putative quinol monooxygenase [Planctomycetota bacterium]